MQSHYSIDCALLHAYTQVLPTLVLHMCCSYAHRAGESDNQDNEYSSEADKQSVLVSNQVVAIIEAFSECYSGMQVRTY
jgi:hypothetical protein